MMKSLLVVSVMLMAASAMAGECMMSIKRLPCPGKDSEAYKPYGGKVTTEESKKVGSAEACAKEAEKACAIVRKGVLTSKEIHAKFDGTPVAGGKNFCDAGRPDYGKCN